jgi:WD40 repeat protein
MRERCDDVLGGVQGAARPRRATAWAAGITAVLMATAVPMRVATPADAAAPTYERDVVPILRTYCAGCHNDADMEGNLSVERFSSLRKGGAESGDPVVAGDPDASVMLRRIASTAGDHMPPADEPQPSAAEVATLRAWIAAGAAGPAVDASLLETLVVPSLPAYAGRLPVTALAIGPDGARAAVARGRSLEVLDISRAPAGDPAAAPVAATLRDLPGRVMAVHFGPDGRTLALAGGVAGLAGVAELRDAATGAVVRTFRGHRDLLSDAEFSPDGTVLATAGYDRSVKLWNTADGTLLRSIDVHNGAVFDLAWHPSGRVLASASADETVKLWRTADGVRLDTLKEPQAEVFAVTFTPDGGHVIAAGRDRRIHLWRLVSLDNPAANPVVQARFAHEAPIVALGLAADGSRLLTAAEDRTLFAWSVPGLERLDDLPAQADLVSVIAPAAAGQESRFLLGRMDGAVAAVGVAARAVAAAPPTGPAAGQVAGDQTAADGAMPPVEVAEAEPNDGAAGAVPIPVPATVTGAIGSPGDADCFRFTARAGVPLLLDLEAARPGSKVSSRLDSRLEVLDAAGAPVERVVLRATRDSWFTFRGKDSSTSDDFRVQNWTEMELDEYLYAGGEVVKLWLYPRGPDSGFKVYPGSRARHTFFGTTPVTHALGEPAWIVEPLPPGSVPAPNGLPVFRLVYENDDDPARRLGTDSQLIFTPPADGEYVVRVTDVRGFGAAGDPAAFRYALTVRPPRPSFSVAVGRRDPKVSPGSGREVTFTVTRLEGFEGPVRIDVANLPAGFTFHGPLEIEAGQQQALGVLAAAADAAAPDEAASKAVTVTATAEIGGAEVTQPLGDLGTLALAAAPKVTVEILAADGTAAPTGGPLEFAIRPGETIRARVRIVRHDQQGPVGFGRDDAGRNLPHGVFVANTGLNGLLVVDGQTEREFFVTAAPIAKPGRRIFHLRCEPDGGQCSVPVVLNVLSP